MGKYAKVIALLTIATLSVAITFIACGGGGGGSSSSPVSYLYFSADGGADGRQVWRYDGINPPEKITTLNPNGSNGFNPKFFHTLDNKLIFAATGSNTQGCELWASDGTGAGTTLLKDINPSGDSLTGDSAGKYFVPYSGALFFNADNGVIDNELWATDGTAEGTTLVHDLTDEAFWPGNPSYLTVFKDKLFFQGDHETHWRVLWSYDASTGITTVEVPDIDGANDYQPEYLSVFSSIGGTDYLIFTADTDDAGTEMWSWDGTAAAPSMVADLNSGSSDSAPRFFTPFSDRFFFRASNGNSGFELFSSDGSASGTTIVRDINPGNTNSNPKELTTYNGNLYFVASGPSNGTELWISNGVASGTTMVADIHPSGNSDPTYLTEFKGALYFAANDSTGDRELWMYNGLDAPTRVADINTTASSSPEYMIVLTPQ